MTIKVRSPELVTSEGEGYDYVIPKKLGEFKSQDIADKVEFQGLDKQSLPEDVLPTGIEKLPKYATPALPNDLSAVDTRMDWLDEFFTKAFTPEQLTLARETFVQSVDLSHVDKTIVKLDSYEWLTTVNHLFRISRTETGVVNEHVLKTYFSEFNKGLDVSYATHDGVRIMYYKLAVEAVYFVLAYYGIERPFLYLYFSFFK